MAEVTITLRDGREDGHDTLELNMRSEPPFPSLAGPDRNEATRAQIMAWVALNAIKEMQKKLGDNTPNPGGQSGAQYQT